MPAILLLRHGSASPEGEKPLSEEGKAEAMWAANSIAAYLELPGDFMPRGFGAKCDVAVVHSGKLRAQQTADCVVEVLTKAGCTVTSVAEPAALAPDADPTAAAAIVPPIVSGVSAPLTIVVGHLPHLHKLAGALGVSEVKEERFTPAGGLLLLQLEGAWKVSHLVQNKVSWWMRGISFYVPSEAA